MLLKCDYSKEINYLSEKVIINGTPEGYFKPSDNVTRGQMAVMLDKALDLKMPYNYKDTFQYIPDNSYYYDAAHKLMHYGYIANSFNFSGERELTRAEMAVALVKAFDLKSTGAHVRFKDVPFTHWAYDYVVILAQNNITVGFPDGSFAPTAKVTREQFAAFLARLQEPSFRPVRN
ncbi:S-layer homology domain-containing protein [Bacillus cereus]